MTWLRVSAEGFSLLRCSCLVLVLHTTILPFWREMSYSGICVAITMEVPAAVKASVLKIDSPLF